MIEKTIGDYKNYRVKKLKRGYKIIGWPLTLGFFVLLLFTFTTLYLVIEISIWFSLIEILIGVLFWIINKKVDGLLRISWLDNEDMLKAYVNCYLEERGFVRSQQFKDLSIVLKEISKKRYKKYDLNPYLAIIVSILIFSLSLVVNDNLKYLIIIVAIGTIPIICSINPLINTFTNIFFNGKDSDIIYELACIIDELYFEVSIKENKTIYYLTI
ncbi:hypothetical protein [Rummeliibacillus pycnus]|uniref:hypothetical protein n=1 Tax=Rummeliibacillus pycnus TaxID=101070 RepID=UPI003D26D3F7